MDRLLRYFLGQFIRCGTMTFTAASGAKFTCGDGTGRPVSARFLNERTQRRILLNPELALGEAAMVAALFQPARQAIQLARSGEKQRRPPLRPRRTALFPLPRRRQA